MSNLPTTDTPLLYFRDIPESVVGYLAQFRYAMRRFLRFSENAARECGVTPQQHQLMLGVAGFTDHGSATVSELAEFMQEQPNSVAGLIERAAQRGLVRRVQDEKDRRVVNVSLTDAGRETLVRLTRLHQEEFLRVQDFLKFHLDTAPHNGEAGVVAPADISAATLKPQPSAEEDRNVSAHDQDK